MFHNVFTVKIGHNFCFKLQMKATVKWVIPVFWIILHIHSDHIEMWQSNVDSGLMYTKT